MIRGETQPCRWCRISTTSSTLKRAVYLLAADNCLSPKTRYNPPITPPYKGLSHDATAVFLSARAPRTVLALCHAPSCLAEPRARVLTVLRSCFYAEHPPLVLPSMSLEYA